METLLELKNIRKEFPGVRALNDVSIHVNSGEALALIGENGAGKSTLIKILTGVYQGWNGEIVWEGRPVKFRMPSEAQELGIATIYQELTLCTNMTVAENIYLGKEPKNAFGFIDRKKMNTKAEETLKRLDLCISPEAEVSSLTVANQQLVEIARALSMNAKLLIMDEPTSSLSNHEVRVLFNVLRGLVNKGISILYVSHKFEEIFEISDRISILRDGEHVKTLNTADAKQEEIIAMMVGRSVNTMYPPKAGFRRELLFGVRNLSKTGQFKGIGFSLSKGEILGFAGLVGAGRTEMIRAVFGIDKADNGEMFIDGKWVDLPKSPSEALELGIGLLPEDRKDQGLVLSMSVASNIVMSTLASKGAKVFVNKAKEKETIKDFIDKLSIKTPSEQQLALNLSGGNQQKVVVAKWLATKSRVLIFDEPTRGIDVGAKAEIYQLMNELTRQGYGIIMISSELPEILGMSDRVIVMHEGRITAELSKDDDAFSPEGIMSFAMETHISKAIC